MPVDDLEPVSVQGRLHEHVGFWIMNWKPLLLSRKLLLRFIGCLSSKYLGLCSSVIITQHWSTRNLLPQLLRSEQCHTVCSPLSIVVNAKGKLSLVLKLHYVNQFIPEQKLKYEGLSLFPQMFNIFSRLTTGYHHAC